MMLKSVLMFTASVAAVSFGARGAFALSDIENYAYKSSIRQLEARGIVGGYADGSFRPFAPINRAEFLKILMLAVYGNGILSIDDRRCFTDFTGTEQWFWLTACAAKQAGIVRGYPDGTFRGENTVTLAEALKMSLEAWQVPLTGDASGPWYERYMFAASQQNIFKVLPYNPAYPLSRGEMALVLTMLGQPISAVNGYVATSSSSRYSYIVPVGAATCGNGQVDHGEECDDGNTLDGDGCSSLCIVVPETIRHGFLKLEQRAIASTGRSSGASDVQLFSIDAAAARQDVYITGLSFKSAAGSLQYGTNYRLLIDRDGDGIAESLFGKAIPEGENLDFGNLSILVQDSVNLRIELVADFTDTLRAGSIAVAFDTSKTDFVQAEDKVDGDDLTGITLNSNDCTVQSTCWISVFTETSTTIPIAIRGNLYVTEDSVTVPPHQILAGSTTDTLLRLLFTANGEDISVKKLAVENVPMSVDHLELLTGAASMPFATMRQGQCATYAVGRFCADNGFNVPRNGQKQIFIRAVLKSDVSGAQSGDAITLALNPATTGHVAVEAQGYYSGQQLLQNNGDSTEDGEIFLGTGIAGPNVDIEGETHTVVLAKIADIVNSDGDPDGTPISAGGSIIGQFRFRAATNTNSANGNNTVKIDKLVFTVNAVNVTMDAGGFFLYNKQNSGVTASCTAAQTTGTITVTCQSLVGGPISTFISSGDSIDLVLRGTVISTSAGTSILQTSLQNLGNPAYTGTVVWSDGAATYQWTDIGKTTVRSTNYRNN